MERSRIFLLSLRKHKKRLKKSYAEVRSDNGPALLLFHPLLLTVESDFPPFFVALPTTSLHHEDIDHSPRACSCLEAIIPSEDCPCRSPPPCFRLNKADPVGETNAVTDGSRTRNTESLMVPERRRGTSARSDKQKSVNVSVRGARVRVVTWRRKTKNKRNTYGDVPGYGSYHTPPEKYVPFPICTFFHTFLEQKCTFSWPI